MTVRLAKLCPALSPSEDPSRAGALSKHSSISAEQSMGSPQAGRENPFEPRILAILCNWCTYSAADSAGSAHSVYPPNIHILRVMCSGRVDPALILRSLKGGMDGVLICGCHPGDCHYISGNYKTAFRIP